LRLYLECFTCQLISRSSNIGSVPKMKRPSLRGYLDIWDIWGRYLGTVYLIEICKLSPECPACDQGKALSSEIPDFKVNLNGEFNLDGCQSNAVCEGAWSICTDCETPTVNCTTGGGSAANVFFDSATDARVESFLGGLGAGALCYGIWNAHPAGE
jgi:hypothetical protein